MTRSWIRDAITSIGIGVALALVAYCILELTGAIPPYLFAGVMK